MNRHTKEFRNASLTVAEKMRAGYELRLRRYRQIAERIERSEKRLAVLHASRAQVAEQVVTYARALGIDIEMSAGSPEGKNEPASPPTTEKETTHADLSYRAEHQRASEDD